MLIEKSSIEGRFALMVLSIEVDSVHLQKSVDEILFSCLSSPHERYLTDAVLLVWVDTFLLEEKVDNGETTRFAGPVKGSSTFVVMVGEVDFASLGNDLEDLSLFKHGSPDQVGGSSFCSGILYSTIRS